MNIEEAEVKLYLRKYQWATVSLAHEIKEGHPNLRTLLDPSLQKSLIHLERFSVTEQLELATLIIKNWYRPAMQLFGEVLSQADEAKIKRYQAEVRNISVPAVFSSPNTKIFAVKRADTAKIVLSLLSAGFGSKPKKLFSLNWLYTAPMGDWQFHTELDFGGTWGTEIRCLHRLVRNDSKSWGLMMMPLPSAVGLVRVPQHFSLLSLYGFPFGVYNIQTTDDAQIAARAILSNFDLLSQAASGWVGNLAID